MPWYYIIYIFLVMTGSLLMFGVGGLAWRRPHFPGRMALVGLVIAVGWWGSNYTFEIILTSVGSKLFFARLEYFGIALVPVFWFLFSMEYSGTNLIRSDFMRNILFAMPIITSILALTYPSSQLLWSDVVLEPWNGLGLLNFSYGPWFWIHTLYSYALLLLGGGIMLNFLRRTYKVYRNQTMSMLGAIGVACLGNILYLFNVGRVDWTALTFIFAGFFLLRGTQRYQLLEIAPIARRMIIDNIGDAVITLDLDNRIIDANPAGLRIVERPIEDVIGKPIRDVVPEHYNILTRYQDILEAEDELRLEINAEDVYYDLRIFPLYDPKGKLRGRLIALRDISERKALENSLAAQMERFQQLLTVARATTEQPTLDVTLRNALHAAIALGDAEQGGIFLMNERGDVTHSHMIPDTPPGVQRKAIVAQVAKSGLTGWVVRERQKTIIEDVHQDSRWIKLPDYPDATRSVLALPILHGQQILGALILQHSRSDHFDVEDSEVMEAAVQQIALAIRNAQIYEEQRRMASQQSTLYKVLRTLQETRLPHQVESVAVDTIARLTGWPIVALLVPSKNDSGLEVIASAGRLTRFSGWLDVLARDAVEEAWQSGASQYYPNIAGGSENPLPVASAFVVPMRLNAQRAQILYLASNNPMAFDPDAQLLAESLVEVIRLTLQNARLYNSLQNELVERQRAEDRLWKSLHKTETLYRVSRSLIGTYHLEEILQSVIDNVAQALSADRVVLLTINEEHGEIRDFIIGGPGKSAQIKISRSAQDGLIGWVIQEGTSVLLEKQEEDPRESPLVRSWRGMPEPGSLAMVPLFFRGHVQGVLLALNQVEQRDFSRQDIDLMMAIAAQIAVAIQNAQLFQTILEERGRLQALVQSSRDGVVLIGTGLRLLVINQPALDYLGLPGTPETWLGEMLWDALRYLRRYASHVVKTTFEELRRMTAGNDAPGEGELLVSGRHLHWLNLPVQARERILGRLLVIQDVTEMRQLEQYREDLTHTMVHDLRNPLTGLNGALKLLARSASDTLSPMQLEILDVAQVSNQRMLKLVNAILDISRLESGRMPLNATAFDIVSVINQTLALQQTLAAQKNLTLTGDLTEEMFLVCADQELIERVLQNLLGNAIKFTPDGGEIRVSARVAPENSKKILLSVQDTGLGIPPELEGRIFQKFVSGNQEGRGSGLGLAFCRMVVEAHNERIWVDSRLGEGTTFTFTLRRVTAAESC